MLKRGASELAGGTPAASDADKTQNRTPVYESKTDVKEYAEMGFFLDHWRASLSASLDTQADPYVDYDKDSEKTNKVVAFASKAGLYVPHTLIKAVTPTMIAQDKHNPFHKLISGYIKRKCPQDPKVGKTVIRHLSKFILQGLDYTFLQIEILFKNDSIKRTQHYTLLRNFCLTLLTHEKWSIDAQRWHQIFSNTTGTTFATFIHKIIWKLNEKLAAAPAEFKSEELRSQTANLCEHIENALATSKEMLLKLISNEEVPADIFTDDAVVDAFSLHTFQYFSDSDAIDPAFKKFVATSERFNFLKAHFFSQEHANAIKQIDVLAATYAAERIKHTKQAIGHSTPERPLLRGPGNSAQSEVVADSSDSDVDMDLEEHKPQMKGTVATVSGAMVVRDGNTQRFSQKEAKVQTDYRKFLDERNASFSKIVESSVPPEIKHALKTTSRTDDVVKTKNEKAKAFVLIIMNVCSIIQVLEKVVILATTIRDFVKEAGALGDWTAEDDFTTLEKDLRQLFSEAQLVYREVIEKSHSLRIEIQKLNQSQWGRNINYVLSDVISVIDDFTAMMPLLTKIRQTMSLQRKVDDFTRILTLRRRMTLQELVFFNITQSRHAFEDSFERMARLTQNAADLQLEYSKPGSQTSQVYLSHALWQQQHALTSPREHTVFIEVVPNEVVELTANDFNQAALSRHGITVDQALKGKIVTTQQGSHLETKGDAGAERKCIPLDASGKHRIAELQGNISASREAPPALPPRPRLPVSTITAPVAESKTPRSTIASASAPHSVVNFSQDEIELVKIDETISTLTADNAKSTSRINDLQSQQAQNDLKKHWSRRYITTSWWWLTGVGFVVHLLVMVAAGAYRLFTQKQTGDCLKSFHEASGGISEHEKNIAERNIRISGLTQQREQILAERERLSLQQRMLTPIQEPIQNIGPTTTTVTVSIAQSPTTSRQLPSTQQNLGTSLSSSSSSMPALPAALPITSSSSTTATATTTTTATLMSTFASSSSSSTTTREIPWAIPVQSPTSTSLTTSTTTASPTSPAPVSMRKFLDGANTPITASSALAPAETKAASPQVQALLEKLEQPGNKSLKADLIDYDRDSKVVKDKHISRLDPLITDIENFPTEPAARATIYNEVLTRLLVNKPPTFMEKVRAWRP